MCGLVPAVSRWTRTGWAAGLIALLCATSVSAQAPVKAFFAINVRDAAVSAAWYAQTFRLQLVNRFDRRAFDQRILASDRLVVELIQLKPLPPRAPERHLGLTKAGVVVADIYAEVVRWKSEGVRFFGGSRLVYDAALGLHTTLLLDPDDNLIQVFGVGSPPQAPLPAEPPFAGVLGAFIALSVPDLDASVRWYSEKLGLSLVSRFGQDKVSGVLLAGGGLEVELLRHADAAAPNDAFDFNNKVLVRGIAKAGFRVGNFDQTIAALRTRGVEIVIGPFPPRRDQRANALIRDNAGNLIQIFGEFAR